MAVLSEDLHAEKLIAVAADPLNTGSFDPMHGFHISMQDHWDTYISGKADHRVYEWLCEQQPCFPLTEDQFIAACEEYYLVNSHTLKVRPGFKETVVAFQNIGIPMAAISSAVRSQVDCNIAVAGVHNALLFSHSANDVEPGKTKPDPTPYLNGLRDMNSLLRQRHPDHIDIQPHECLVVEDSDSGATAGVRAGMRVIHWLLTPTAQAHPDAAHGLAHCELLSEYVTRRLFAQQTFAVQPSPDALSRKKA